MSANRTVEQQLSDARWALRGHRSDLDRAHDECASLVRRLSSAQRRADHALVGIAACEAKIAELSEQ